MTCRVDIDGQVVGALLRDTLRRAVTEAEGLHTRFSMVDGEPGREAVRTDGWELTQLDLSEAADPAASAEKWLRGRRNHTFDPTGEPPFEVALLRLSSERWIGHLGYHQLVLDAAGAEVLVARWAEIYASLVSGDPVPACPFGSDTDLDAREPNAPAGLGTAVAVLAAYTGRMRDVDEVTVRVVHEGRTPATRDVPTRLASVVPVHLDLPATTTWAELRAHADDVLGAPAGPPPVITVAPGTTTLALGAARGTVRHLCADDDSALLCRVTADGALVVDVGGQPWHDADAALPDHRDRLAALLTEATTNPDAGVHDGDLATARDRARVLDRWNDTAAPLPAATVPELFDRQAAEKPDAVAVECGPRRLTYGQLQAMANRLASELAARGVAPGDRVGVLMARSADLVVAQLAVARTGAAYVPLDLRSPASRMRTILHNVDAHALLVDEANRDHEATEGQQVLVVADVAPAGPGPDVVSTPDTVLYVMHTSGSTGEPKGVEATHRNVVAHALDRAWRGEAHRAVLFHSSHAFDAATYEVWVPLLTGGRVVVATEELNAPLLRALVGGGRVTSLFLTTGLFNALAEGDPGCFQGAHEVWTGGNVTSTRAVERVTAACPDTTVVNVYGPTETTTFVTYHRVPRPMAGDARLPIGAPMDNTRAYVLDERRRLLPPGAVGQLYIGGAGVARGYANRPDLTAERFLPDPFGGDRMYATGDLVRWRQDGQLDFLGRVDDQVKIHGFRIEPGEIEAVLGTHPEVSQAVVVARTFADAGGRITAYVVADEPDAPPTEESLRGHLAERLPEYMVPARIVVRRHIPLTRNGKIDMTRLAEPAPATPTERALAELWAELLESPPTSGAASFWELGGHSLLGVKLVARMRDRFGVELTLRHLFRHPRLADLAAVVDDAMATPAGVDLPASAFQQRIWLAEKFDPEPGLYHIPLAWRVAGRLDPDRLATAVARVVERHEALRTTFTHRDGELRQIIGAPWRPAVRVDRCDDEAKLPEQLRDEADRPFDLTAGPLLRVGLVEAPDGQVLTITVHHIVFDASSLDLLLAETSRCYAEDPGPVEPADRQYRDFVAAHDEPDPAALRRRVDGLRGAPSRLPVAVPTEREPHGVVALDLPDDVVRRLRVVQDELGMSWFMVAAGALAALLHGWTGSSDLTFGFPTEVRAGGEFAGVVGPCLNMVVVRSRCAAGTTVTELLEQVRDGVLEAVEDQHVPYGAIVDELNPPRSADSTPYLDVAVGPQVRSAVLADIGGHALRPISTAAGTGTVGKFAVIVTLSVHGDRMTGSLSYRGDRLSADMATGLARQYVAVLDTVLEDRHATVSALVPSAPVAPEPVVRPAEPATAGALEARVAEIWASLLEVEHVRAQDNFFDLGGNSVKLVTLHARLCGEFGTTLPIQRLFENSTVRSMARFLGETGEAGETGGKAQPAAGLDAATRGAARRDRVNRRAGSR